MGDESVSCCIHSAQDLNVSTSHLAHVEVTRHRKVHAWDTWQADTATVWYSDRSFPCSGPHGKEHSEHTIALASCMSSRLGARERFRHPDRALIDNGTHQRVVRSLRDQDLVLLLDGEVGVRVFRVDILLVQVQDFVVADGSRVAKVEDSLTNKRPRPRVYRPLVLTFRDSQHAARCTAARRDMHTQSKRDR